MKKILKTCYLLLLLSLPAFVMAFPPVPGHHYDKPVSSSWSVLQDDPFIITELPYEQNFDQSSSMPEGWTFSGRSYNIATNFFTSPMRSFQINNWGGERGMLISPMIDFDIQDIQVEFSVRLSNQSGTFDVGVLTDPNDTSTFVPIQRITATDADFHFHIVQFTDYIGDAKYIAFRRIAPGQSTYLDDIVIREAAACQIVRNVRTGSISGGSALLTWEASISNPDNYTVEYTIRGEDNWQQLITASTSITLSPLNEKTYYDVRVKANCVEESSDWVTTGFYTLCNVFGGPLAGNESSQRISNSLPAYPGMRHSYTQQIYKAAELGGEETDISYIAFRYVPASGITRNLNIYLGHTTDTTFSNTSSWIEESELTPVFSGNVYFNNTNDNNWVYILLDQPFHFNGNDNLALAVMDNTGRADAATNAFVIDSIGPRNSLYLATSNPISISSPSDGSLTPSRNVVRFLDCEEVECLIPRLLHTSFIGGTDADIAWTEDGTALAYEIQYKEVSDEEWTSEITANTSFTLQPLTAQTEYDVRVRAICTVTDTSDWATLRFRTDCADYGFPFHQTFDTLNGNSFPECWRRYTTLGTNLPYVDYPQNSDYYNGPGRLHLNVTTGGQSMAVLPRIDVPSEEEEIMMSFWAKTSSGNAGLLIIGTLDDPADYTTFTPLDTVSFRAENSWNEYEFIMNLVDLTGKNIALQSYNASSFYMDDLYIGAVSECPKPLDVEVTGVSHASAELTWNARNSSTWIIEYGMTDFVSGTGTVDTIYDNPYTVTGLQDNTQYDLYIRTLCEDETSRWTKTGFHTRCSPITEDMLPITYDFDELPLDQSSLPVCWSKISTNTRFQFPIPYQYGSDHVLRFQSDDTDYSIAIMRELDENASFSELMLRFEFWAHIGSANVQIGIMTDPEDAATFERVVTYSAPTSGRWVSGEAMLDSYTGAGRYIAFKVTGLENKFDLNDVTLMKIPTCEKPSPVTVTNITLTTAHATWTPAGDESEWMLEYNLTGILPYSRISVSGNPEYTFTGLTPERSYTVRVTAICGAGDTSNYTATTRFTTLDLCQNAPQNFTVEDTTTNGATLSWNIGELETTWRFQVRKTSGSYTDSTTLTTNSITLSGLTPDTEYEARVKTVCDGDIYSPYTTITFRTKAIVYHTITAIAGSHGRIFPEGTIRVVEGSDTTFTITPDTDYRINAVVVDGEDMGSVERYTFTNVRENHSISASFMTTGINDYSRNRTMTLYPNPAQNTLHVRFDYDAESIAITNLLGKVMWSAPFTEREMEIDVNFLGKGLYFLTTYSREGNNTRKFIKE